MAQARKYGWLIVLLLALTSVANVGIEKFRNPEAQPAPELGAIPHRIGEWESGANLVMEQYVLDILRPDAYVSREYRAPSGERIYLFAQFHGTNRWGAHQPEVCFTSQGWTIEYEKLSSTMEKELPGTEVSANRFLAHRGSTTQIVLYWWFSSGNFQTASRTAQMISALKTQLFTGKGGGNGFVEVSMQVRPGQEAEDEERLRRFAAELVPLIAAVIEARGQASS